MASTSAAWLYQGVFLFFFSPQNVIFGFINLSNLKINILYMGVCMVDKGLRFTVSADGYIARNQCFNRLQVFILFNTFFYFLPWFAFVAFSSYRFLNILSPCKLNCYAK